MTYVEFFDKTAAKNICSCLTNTPERVILLGDKGDLMAEHIENYKKVFAGRDQEVEFLYRTVSRSDVERSVRLLTEIVEKYDDCVFDLPGGEEVLALALGIVYATHPEKNIQIHRFNVNNGTFYDCDKDGVTIYEHNPQLTVRENIRLYGGDVMFGGVSDDDKTYRWDMNEEFVADINRMWDVCKKDFTKWNILTSLFGIVEKVGEKKGLTTTATKWAVERQLKREREEYRTDARILKELRSQGLLTEFDDASEDSVTISYKNEQIKRCLIKAGQVLEMKVFAVARAIVNEDGTPVYNDAMNGVFIDWDGKKTKNDTENEIDVLLMHGIVPVFVSCKNGSTDSDELYKLNTVAERFGGEYAQKVVVATSLSKRDQGDSFRQRAEEMNIKIIEPNAEMTDEVLARRLKHCWTNGSISTVKKQ